MVTTPDMGLVLPVVQTTLGPAWATELNAALNVVDSHDHSTGSGAKITPSGININTNFSMGSNNITLVRSTRYDSQSAVISGASDLNAVYVVNGNLYYINNSGTNVQITDGAGLNFASLGTIGGDFGQPGVNAAVTYSDSTKVFAFTQSSGIGAIIAGSKLKIAYASGSTQAVTLAVTAGVTAYEITLPDGVAAVDQSICTMSTTGQMSFTTTLSADLTISGDIAYSGTPLVSGNITRTGTATGGTYSGITLAGTIAGAITYSGVNTFTLAPVFSSVTASEVLGVDASKNLISAPVTGTGSVVKDTSPTITSPTIASPTLSGTITTTGSTIVGLPIISSVTASQILAVDASKNLTSLASTGTGNVVRTTSPTIDGATFTGSTTGNGIVPVGGIVAIGANITGSFSLPATGVVSNGWMICDGAAIPGSQTLSGNTPNLMDSRFLMGSSGTAGVSSGSNTNSHTHSVTSNVTSQTVAHSHGKTLTAAAQVWTNTSPNDTSTVYSVSPSTHTHQAGTFAAQIYASPGTAQEIITKVATIPSWTSSSYIDVAGVSTFEVGARTTASTFGAQVGGTSASGSSSADLHNTITGSMSTSSVTGTIGTGTSGDVAFDNTVVNNAVTSGGSSDTNNIPLSLSTRYIIRVK